MATIAAVNGQPFSPASSHHSMPPDITSPHHAGYQKENPCTHCSPATPITHDDQFSNPSTPMQLSSPSAHQTLHSTPHGPSSILVHSKQAHPINNLLNCSPLVKADLHPGSPRMAQKGGPQAKKNIFHTCDTKVIQQSVANNWSVPLNPELGTSSEVTNLVTNKQEAMGYLNLLSEAIDEYNNGDLLENGTSDLFSSLAPCTTIENSIECISLPKPEPVTMVARKHGQGKGKKGKKKPTKKGW